MRSEEWLRWQGDDLLLQVRVRPRAGREAIQGVRDGRLQIRIPGAPVDGEANRQLLRCLARALHLAVSRLRIVRGSRSRDKTIMVQGIKSVELQLPKEFQVVK